MSKTKIGNRYYTQHDFGLSKREANEQIAKLKSYGKYKYFRKIKRADGYSVYKGT